MHLSIAPTGQGAVTPPYALSVGFSKASVSALQPWAFSICHSRGMCPKGDKGSASCLSRGGEKRMEA